jgi:hypothetical protein
MRRSGSLLGSDAGSDTGSESGSRIGRVASEIGTAGDHLETRSRSGTNASLGDVEPEIHKEKSVL